MHTETKLGGKGLGIFFGNVRKKGRDRSGKAFAIISDRDKDAVTDIAKSTERSNGKPRSISLNNEMK